MSIGSAVGGTCTHLCGPRPKKTGCSECELYCWTVCASLNLVDHLLVFSRHLSSMTMTCGPWPRGWDRLGTQIPGSLGALRSPRRNPRALVSLKRAGAGQGPADERQLVSAEAPGSHAAGCCCLSWGKPFPAPSFSLWPGCEHLQVLPPFLSYPMAGKAFPPRALPRNFTPNPCGERGVPAQGCRPHCWGSPTQRPEN